MTADFITVVSGVPRSGTSMMMRMLEAGGMPVLTDSIRSADPDNPLGYYEFEPVKGLARGDTAWISLAQGKAVKIISALIEHLPPDHHYRLVFMHRQIAEVIASQRKMLLNRGESPSKIGDQKLAEMLEKHLNRVTSWLALQHNFTVLTVNYNQLVLDPLPQVLAVNRFLGDPLDVPQMCAVVNTSLYRNRSAAG